MSSSARTPSPRAAALVPVAAAAAATATVAATTTTNAHNDEQPTTTTAAPMVPSSSSPGLKMTIISSAELEELRHNNQVLRGHNLQLVGENQQLAGDLAGERHEVALLREACKEVLKGETELKAERDLLQVQRDALSVRVAEHERGNAPLVERVHQLEGLVDTYMFMLAGVRMELAAATAAERSVYPPL